MALWDRVCTRCSSVLVCAVCPRHWEHLGLSLKPAPRASPGTWPALLWKAARGWLCLGQLSSSQTRHGHGNTSVSGGATGWVGTVLGLLCFRLKTGSLCTGCRAELGCLLLLYRRPVWDVHRGMSQGVVQNLQIFPRQRQIIGKICIKDIPRFITSFQQCLNNFASIQCLCCIQDAAQSMQQWRNHCFATTSAWIQFPAHSPRMLGPSHRW